MREEDRLALGRDYTGDVDEEAPVAHALAEAGQPILGFAQRVFATDVRGALLAASVFVPLCLKP